MSEQLDLIALHQRVVENEYEGTDYTQQMMSDIIIKCRTQYGTEKTDKMVKAAKLYAAKHPQEQAL